MVPLKASHGRGWVGAGEVLFLVEWVGHVKLGCISVNCRKPPESFTIYSLLHNDTLEI